VEKAFGKDHPDMANVLDIMAKGSRKMGGKVEGMSQKNQL
jgi:hypothetical protein